MINILTSFFNKNKYGNHNKENLEKRNLEYNNTLIFNLQKEYIEKIYLFIEDEYSLSILDDLLEKNNLYKDKVVKILFNKQPMYSDFFLYSNNHLKDKLVMITNSDIYLDSYDNHLIQKYILNKNNVFSLTRHEWDNTKRLIDKYMGSHDSFIFKSPVNKNIIDKSTFYQNIPGSENLIIYLFHINKYTLFNPCFQFKIVHLHASQVRNYKGKRINNQQYMHGYIEKKIKPCHLK
jgi:hypothetical protein